MRQCAKDIMSKDLAWRLRLVFAQFVDAPDIREAWQDGFEKNTGSNVNELHEGSKFLTAG